MKPFRFPLQPIRVLRERKEQVAQQRFAQAMLACEEAASHLQAASDDLAAGWNSLCEELSSGVVATHLTRTRAWCSILEQRQKERAAALQHARRLMDAAFRDMMLASRDRETLDRYHDKCRRAHNLESQREDQKLLDEIGVRRAVTPSSLPETPRPGENRL